MAVTPDGVAVWLCGLMNPSRNITQHVDAAMLARMDGLGQQSSRSLMEGLGHAGAGKGITEGLRQASKGQGLTGGLGQQASKSIMEGLGHAKQAAGAGRFTRGTEAASLLSTPVARSVSINSASLATSL